MFIRLLGLCSLNSWRYESVVNFLTQFVIERFSKKLWSVIYNVHWDVETSGSTSGSIYSGSFKIVRCKDVALREILVGIRENAHERTNPPNDVL